MTIYPLGPDTYRAEWTGGFVAVGLECIERCDGTEWYVLASDGAWPEGHLEAVLRAAIVDVHLDRLANRDPAP